MSYEADAMNALRRELERTQSLKRELQELNRNLATLDRLTKAIELQNQLKMIELGINNKNFTK